MNTPQVNKEPEVKVDAPVTNTDEVKVTSLQNTDDRWSGALQIAYLWHITSEDEVVNAIHNSGKQFSGTMEEFNKKLRGD